MQRKAFVRLDSDHQAIRIDMHLRCSIERSEHRDGRPVERHDDLADPLRQTLARAQIEGNPLPPPVGDLQSHCHECLGCRVGHYLLLLQISRFPIRPFGVLPIDHFMEIDRRYRAKHLHLLLADILGCERGRRLHRRQGQELRQMVLQHVA